MVNKVGVSTNTYHGFTLEEALKGISDAGFKYVELTAVKGWTEHVTSDMTDEEILEVKGMLKNYDLTPIALSGHCNLMDEDRLGDFIDNIELADKFDCKFIVTSTGEAHFGTNEDSPEEILIANLKKALVKCEELDIMLVLEIHGEHGTGEALYNLVTQIDSDYLGINYDTANVIFYGKKCPEDDIKTCVDRVDYVHLKDKAGEIDEWNFPAIGKGNLKFEEIFKYLDENGYDGPLSIEVEFTEKGPADLGEIDRAVKDSYDYLKSIGITV